MAGSLPELHTAAARVRAVLVERYPEWAERVEVRANGDLELAVPAPRGSRARHLVVFTHEGGTWIRFAPPRSCYLAGSERELLAVIAALLADDAFLVVVTNGDEWLETSLLRPGQEPVLAFGQVADVLSWSGRHDRVVTPLGQPRP